MRRSLLVLLIFARISSFSQDSKNVILLDQWTTDTIPQTQDDATFNDVWAFEIKGKEYAVIGSTVGGYILEINNENKLNPVAFIPSRGGLSWNIYHRDYKTYRNYLYCVSDESSGLQIVDLSHLPDSIHIAYSSDSLMQFVHNIYIDTAKATLYVCGYLPVNNSYNNMAVYSIIDPLNPQLLSTLTGFDYIHDAFVRNDTAYLNCGASGLYVYKFNNGSNPQLLGYLDYYPSQGFNHSGWLSENGKYYVFADETPGKKIKICDVTNLYDITVLDLFNSGTISSNINNATIPHNLMWKNDYVYVSHYYDGLQIFDVRDKTNVEKVAWYDTHTNNSAAYSGAWGIYCFLKDNKVLISDRNSGLFLFKTNFPPRINSDLDAGIYPNPASDEVYFYMKSEQEGNYRFKIFDVTGKLIYIQENILQNYFLFNVSKWASGSYYYHWEGMNSDISFKGKFLVIHP